jgi:hypothetical protein
MSKALAYALLPREGELTEEIHLQEQIVEYEARLAVHLCR